MAQVAALIEGTDVGVRIGARCPIGAEDDPGAGPELRRMKAGASDEVRGRWTDTLAARITLVVMGILLAFSATLGGAVYIITAGCFTRTAEDHLEALATTRQAAIEVQVARHTDALRAFAEPDVADGVRALCQTQGEPSETTHTALAAELVRDLRTSESLESAFLLGPEGQIRFAPSISIGR